MNLSGYYHLGQFWDKLLNDKPSERLALIHRMELLKDIRILESRLGFTCSPATQFLVFSLIYNSDESEVPVAHESSSAVIWMITFSKPGDSEENGRRERALLTVLEA